MSSPGEIRGNGHIDMPPNILTNTKVTSTAKNIEGAAACNDLAHNVMGNLTVFAGQLPEKGQIPAGEQPPIDAKAQQIAFQGLQITQPEGSLVAIEQGGQEEQGALEDDPFASFLEENKVEEQIQSQPAGSIPDAIIRPKLEAAKAMVQERIEEATASHGSAAPKSVPSSNPQIHNQPIQPPRHAAPHEMHARLPLGAMRTNFTEVTTVTPHVKIEGNAETLQRFIEQISSQSNKKTGEAEVWHITKDFKLEAITDHHIQRLKEKPEAMSFFHAPTGHIHGCMTPPRDEQVAALRQELRRHGIATPPQLTFVTYTPQLWGQCTNQIANALQRATSTAQQTSEIKDEDKAKQTSTKSAISLKASASNVDQKAKDDDKPKTSSSSTDSPAKATEKNLNKQLDEVRLSNERKQKEEAKITDKQVRVEHTEVQKSEIKHSERRLESSHSTEEPPNTAPAA